MAVTPLITLLAIWCKIVENIRILIVPCLIFNILRIAEHELKRKGASKALWKKERDKKEEQGQYCALKDVQILFYSWPLLYKETVLVYYPFVVKQYRPAYIPVIKGDFHGINIYLLKIIF